MMDGRAILRVDIGFYMGTVLRAEFESLHGLDALQA